MPVEWNVKGYKGHYVTDTKEISFNENEPQRGWENSFYGPQKAKQSIFKERRKAFVHVLCFSYEWNVNELSSKAKCFCKKKDRCLCISCDSYSKCSMTETLSKAWSYS